jgi:hypothetical protein
MKPQQQYYKAATSFQVSLSHAKKAMVEILLVAENRTHSDDRPPVPLRHPEMNPILCGEQTQSKRLRYGTELWPFIVSCATLHTSHEESRIKLVHIIEV